MGNTKHLEEVSISYRIGLCDQAASNVHQHYLYRDLSGICLCLESQIMSIALLRSTLSDYKTRQTRTEYIETHYAQVSLIDH